MNKQTYKNFCSLTVKEKRIQYISEILNNENVTLDILFQSHFNKLENLTVLQAEREAALDNLRLLTAQLQTKRLRTNAKASCKYFTL